MRSGLDRGALWEAVGRLDTADLPTRSPRRESITLPVGTSLGASHCARPQARAGASRTPRNTRRKARSRAHRCLAPCSLLPFLMSAPNSKLFVRLIGLMRIGGRARGAGRQRRMRHQIGDARREDLDGMAPRRQLSIDRRAIELGPSAVLEASAGDDSRSFVDGFHAKLSVGSGMLGVGWASVFVFVVFPPPLAGRSLPTSAQLCIERRQSKKESSGLLGSCGALAASRTKGRAPSRGTDGTRGRLRDGPCASRRSCTTRPCQGGRRTGGDARCSRASARSPTRQPLALGMIWG